MMMRYNIVVNGEFGNWYPSSRKRGKNVDSSNGGNRYKYSIVSIIKNEGGGQECEKMWIIGGLPKHGRLVKGDLGQKIWT